MNTKFAGKRALCALTLIALGAATGSAFAQSTEYRRGYDQGYRDGAEAQAGQQGGRAGRIVIEEASYGTRDNVCDAREGIQRAAGWRRQVSVVADNGLCGDPAPNRPKRLSVSYRCGDAAVQRIQTREGGSLSISCR